METGLALECSKSLREGELTVAFEVLGQLGRGSFASVSLVRSRINDKLFALKSLDKSAHNASLLAEVFANEFAALKALAGHPFVLKLDQVFQTEKHLHFALEYCAGGELLRLLEFNGQLPESWLRFYAAQVVLALEAIHEKGFIYRDLKPENVLLCADGYIKLADFGMAEPLSSDREQRACGTREYFSPELLGGKRVGKAADWWSLGCLLYELAVGKPPFSSTQNDSNGLFDSIVNDKPTFPESLSPELRSLIDSLLTKNPKKRLGSRGAGKVKSHAWFQSTDWKTVALKLEKAPHFPDPTRLGLNNFDEEDTKDQESFEKLMISQINFNIKDVLSGGEVKSVYSAETRCHSFDDDDLQS